MLEKTKLECISITKNFYRLNDIVNPCIETIEGPLIEAANRYRKPYWLRLRNAISVERLDGGDLKTGVLIKGVAFPLGRLEAYKNNQKLKKSKRQHSANNITDTDYFKIFNAAKNDPPLQCAILLARHLGCRLNEIEKIELLSDGRIFIPGLKKTADGKRGIDRFIIGDENLQHDVRISIEVISQMPDARSSRSERLRQRLNTLVKRVLGQQKSQQQILPTFKTFRHQCGSDFKSILSDIEKRETQKHLKQFPDPEEAELTAVDRSESIFARLKFAYILGHQCTSSLDDYGDRRKSQIRGGDQLNTDSYPLEPGISMAEITKLVRADHDVPYSEQMKTQLVNDKSAENTSRESDTPRDDGDQFSL